MDSPICVITGAAGFIGSHLTDRLLGLGREVIGLDNMLLGRRENLAAALGNPKFHFHEMDVNDPEACAALVARIASSRPVEAVWHLAANSDIQAGGLNPEVDLRATFMTTFNVLRMMQALKIPEIIFASTSAIYGEHPGAVREDAGPLFPISNYGAMKLASEGLISAALERYLRRACLCRFPNVVGSRATHGAIYDFIAKLRRNPSELEVLGDGNQEKPYLHVGELIDAMVHIFVGRHSKLEFFNIAPDSSASTVRYMAEAVIREMAPGARIRYTGGSRGWIGDVPKFAYSIEKIKAAGWTPRLTSNQAVDLAIRENLGRA